MKNIIFIVIFLYSINAAGQTSFGFRAGVVGSKIDRTHNESTRFYPVVDFSGGVFVNIKLIKKLSFQPEILFSRMGYSYKYIKTDAANNYQSTPSQRQINNYIVIPLLLKAYFGESVFFNIGPTPSVSTNYGVNAYFGGTVSIGTDFKINEKIKTFIEARYYKDFNKSSLALYTGLVF